MSRISRVAMASGAAFALALTGCSGGGQGGSNGSGGGGKTITIGLSSPLSGAVGPTGTANACGLEAYFAAANAADSFHGYKVNIVKKDNQFDPTAAATIARQFATDKVDAVFITGTLIGDASRQVLKAAQIPTFLVGDGQVLTPPKWPGEYGLQPPYDAEMKAALKFLHQNLGHQVISLVNSQGAGGEGLAAAWPDAVKKIGFTAGAQPRVDYKAQDYSGYAQQLKDGGATAVFAALPDTNFASLQKAADAIGYHPTWAVTGFGYSPTYREAVGKLANGVYVAQWTTPVSDSENAGVKTFLADVKKFGDKCDTSSPNVAVGYDLGAIMGKAFAAATADGKAPTFTSIQSALSSVSNEAIGTVPAATFSDRSHAAVSAVSFWEVEGATMTQKSDLIKLGD